MQVETRIRKAMKEKGIGALVATTPENVAYLTGFYAVTHVRHSMRRVYAVLGAGEDCGPDLVLPSGLLDIVAMGGVRVQSIVTYGSFYVSYPQKALDGPGEERAWLELVSRCKPERDFFTALVKLLSRYRGQGDTYGVDEGRVTPQEWGMLERAVPGVRLVPAHEFLRGLRAVKSSAEVEGIRAATAITEAALHGTLEMLREGITELDVAHTFMSLVAGHGALPTLVCIGSGPRSAFPTVRPSERQLQRGDVVRFDVGCLYNGYHSDLARTAVMGTPSAKQRSYYAALLAGQRAALSLIRPGVPACDVFRTAVEEVRSKGITHYQRHHVGHGEGFEGYEPPLLTPENEAPLEEGMVVCVETPYYEVGFGGLQVEDTVVVTHAGCASLSTMPSDLFVVQ